LHELSDDELIDEHDKLAMNTFVGTQYYLDELRRRELLRAMEASDHLARASLRLARAAYGSPPRAWCSQSSRLPSPPSQGPSLPGRIGDQPYDRFSCGSSSMIPAKLRV
jgi:hypothetical protein